MSDFFNDRRVFRCKFDYQYRRSFFYKWLGVLAQAGVISWAYKDQSCIENLTIEQEFIALSYTRKYVY